MDIAYDDGDFEVNVVPENVLKVGSWCIANISGRGSTGRCVAGVVKTINADGSCTVHFEGGWGRKKVETGAIREKLAERPARTEQRGHVEKETLPRAALTTARSWPLGKLIMVSLGALGVAGIMRYQG